MTDRPSPRTNVIWVIADQLRAQATGYAGDPNLATPNLDRLAAEGTNFTRAVAGSPLCSPFRGALVSGQYPHHNGVAGHGDSLPAGTRTVAHAFRDAGYRTCYVGKWHLDGIRPPGAQASAPASGGSHHYRDRLVPPERRAGFQDWWAYENDNRPFDCRVHTDAGNVPDGVQVVAEADGMVQFRVPGYESDGLTDLLLDWLRRHTTERAEQPFFAVLSVQPPHNPYTAPAEVMARHTPGQVQLRPNVCLPGQPWLMFHLADDPYELVNLAHDPACRSRRAELDAQLRWWVERTEDRFPLAAIGAR